MNYLKRRKVFRIKCYRCQGTGRIIEEENFKKSGYKKLICPRCGGTGKTPKIK